MTEKAMVQKDFYLIVRILLEKNRESRKQLNSPPTIHIPYFFGIIYYFIV